MVGLIPYCFLIRRGEDKVRLIGMIEIEQVSQQEAGCQQRNTCLKNLTRL